MKTRNTQMPAVVSHAPRNVVRLGRLSARLVPLLVLAPLFSGTAARADIAPGTDVSSAQLLETETDRCGGHGVRVTSGKLLSGPAVLTNTSDVSVFAVSSPDIQWNCEDGSDKSKERTKCPAQTNVVKVRRGKDRLLTTQCLNYTPPAPPSSGGGSSGPDLSNAKLLSTETDRCGRRGVRITVGTKLAGPDVILEGSSAEAVFGVTSPEIHWTCEEGSSTSSERTRCPDGTNLIKMHRGADRLVATKCMKLPAKEVEATIADFRAKKGFSFVNSSKFQDMVGGYTFDDLTELFGKCETHMFGCSIPDPLAVAYQGIINAALQTGQCFGFSLSSMRFGNGQMPLSFFPSYDGSNEDKNVSPTDVWHLTGKSFTDGKNVSPKLSHYIHLQHMLQLSSESLHSFVGDFFSMKTPAGLKASALAAARNGGGIVSVHSGTSGHAMAVYDVKDLGGGSYGIETYNPNHPFTTGESSDATAHANKLLESRITVTPNGRFKLGTGAKYEGPMTSIAILPYSIYTSQQHLPTSLQGLGNFIFGGVIVDQPRFARVSQVTDAQGHTLLNADGSLNMDPRTRIPGSLPIVPVGGARDGAQLFALDGKGTYTHTIDGGMQGSYDARFVGRGYSVELVDVPTSGGDKDTLTLDGKSAGFELKTSSAQKRFRAKLQAKAGDGSVRVVTMQGLGFKDAPVRVTFDGGRDVITYTHAGGPATLTFGFSSTQRGGTANVTATPVQVDAGDTVTLRPGWAQLATSPGTLLLKKRVGPETSRPIK